MDVFTKKTMKTSVARASMSKELIFGQIFAVITSFGSDFLQPLGNITIYILIFSAVAALILIVLYLTKKLLRKKVFKYFLSAITVMMLSGCFYFFQDESTSDTGLLAANFPVIGGLQSNLGMIEKDISEIKESALRTEQLVESIAEDSKEDIKQTKELNKTIKDSNKAIVNKLDELNDSFTEISKLGGLIVDPQNPAEFIHNSKVYEERGDYFNARRSYNQYFAFKLDFIDPHLRYQTFLKIQEGRAGAREVYNSFFENDQRVVIEFLKILLFNAPTRTNLLKDFISRNPDFAPARHELSKDFSPSRTGQDTLSNRRLELAALEQFIRLNNEGKFVRYFLDKSLAAEWIRYAEERLKILNSGLNEIKETYFNDGKIFKKTNYRNGVKEGAELVYKNKNDSITVFDGLIVNHGNQGREINIKVSDLSWYKDKTILVKRNFYKEGELNKTVNISYYRTGEIFKKETSIPASEESLKLLLDNLSIEQWMQENDRIRDLEYVSNNCDDNSNSNDCIGLGFGFSSFDRERRIKKIEELEQEIDNATEITGPYQFFYKNGQVEDEGVNKNGKKVSYSFFSKDGMLEKVVQAK